ncbi:MAG: efflux RND transporter periplasmic adaptor subunit [Alphaproteobacteria bacterium]|nr:efflux RND transporter periplasmic adaptor subunit [Alphaproteobacteria bacterium]
MADEAEVRKTLEVRRSRVGLWIGGVALVALVAGGLWLRASRRDVGAPWETAGVERGELSVRVTAVGRVQPVDEVSIGSELSGIVADVRVDTNDTVRAGQILATLDADVLEAQAAQSHAAVDAAEATARQARVRVDAARQARERVEALQARGAASAEARDLAVTDYKVAVAALALAEAQLEQSRAADAAARTNLEKAKITSPIDGVVLERNVEAGQAVVSSLQAATLFRVARDLTHMRVEVEVDEADVGRIEAGQQADFTVAAHRDRVFPAVVSKVDLAPVASTDVVQYGAELRVDNPDGALRPGMTATASIETRTFSDVLLVPNAALRFAPPGVDLEAPRPIEGRRVERVWTWDGEQPVPHEVLPISTDGRRTAIEAGALEEGAVVVVGERKKK